MSWRRIGDSVKRIDHPETMPLDASLVATMEANRTALDALLALLPAHRRVCLLDYPVHRNVGDLLILLGEEQFLREHRIDVVYRASLLDYDPDRLRRLAPDAVILCHGGGNFGDLWPQHQQLRCRIVRDFPDRRIIILPQSIHFSEPAALERDAACFSAHADLHVCVRDAESEAVARTHLGGASVRLLPDMAHALWGHLHAPAPTRRDTLVLLRQDLEGALPHAGGASVDWETFLTPREEAAYLRHARLYRLARHLQAVRLASAHVAWYRAASFLVRRAVALFAPYPEVRSDRMHAMILACLLGRRVVFHDNTYGKLSRYHRVWLAGADTVVRSEPG